MRRLVLALACVSLSANDWTWKDTTREAIFAGVWAIDWAQTRGIGEGKEETNPCMGKHPSSSKINGYFITGLVAHVGISATLPPNWREFWQVTTIIFEVIQTRHNTEIGIKMRW